MDKKINMYAAKALVLFFVASVAFTALFVYSGGGIFRSPTELDEYNLYFTVKDISANSARYFVEGDMVTAEGGIVLGELKGIEKIAPAQVYVTKSGGGVEIIEYPENSRVDVYGSISARGVSAGRFLLGGAKHIASGDVFSVSTEHLDVVLTITEIVKK